VTPTRHPIAPTVFYAGFMSTRARILWFGSAGLLVLGGALSAALVGGATGELLALALIGIGLVGATTLVFLEVGLSEDRERARDLKRRREPAPKHAEPPRLGRMRGRPRRLR
jgi:hypothetical protein